MAAQDFRHAAQEDHEKVGDFIHRCERLFKLASGRDAISAKTRNTLLYSQLQEGLRHRITESPAVSGATDYSTMCLAAKAKEKHLTKLEKRQQYHSDTQGHKHPSTPKPEDSKPHPKTD